MTKNITLSDNDNQTKSSVEAKESNDGVDMSSLSVMRWSVGDFVSFVYRRGGLGSSSFSSLLENAGIKTHQQFFGYFKKSQPQGDYFIEYPLKTTYTIPPIRFEIQGRADLIAESPDHQIQVIEIKSIVNDSHGFPDKADFLHLAQARIYAYLYCLERQLADKTQQIKVTVKYIMVQSFQIRDFDEWISFQALEQFFKDTCRYYLEWGVSIRDYEFARDSSIQKLVFPYAELRQGQKEFMNTVLASIRKREPLLVQAPTGTGKTISVLYPAIKSIPKQYADYIFYLTAKSSTQDVAIKSLDDLREQGMILKTIQLTAKEKICLCKELYCDPMVCPYAVHYYENYADAMKELARFFSIDAALLAEIGRQYEVCPFELGLDVSLFCDVIIGDYNYIFDPKVQLERFVHQESYRFTLMIDEAHNLPDRANEMYSASISFQDLVQLRNLKTFFSDPTRESVDRISIYFEKLFSFMAKADAMDSGAEVESFDTAVLPKEMFCSSYFCATRKMPKEFLKLLDIFTRYAKEDLDQIQDATAKTALKELFFSAKFFLRVAEEFFNDSYITTFEKDGENTLVHFRCMDSSGQIAKLHQGKHSTIFFSATLSPLSYFENKFRDTKSAESIKSMILPSPFPRENLLVGIVPGISTKYQNRKNSLGAIAAVIEAAISCKIGNYIVYSPSFEYQQWIIYAFESLIGSKTRDSTRIIRQTPRMSEKNQHAFLKEFQHFGNQTLIAFAVMGGVFSEGIDLVGESLSGVVLVGVGLPKKSPERDIIMDYYSSIIGNGYNFAYRYPGFNKIMQAAGRVIRSETDRGFILLLDERYETPEYQMLFPEEWKPVLLKNLKHVRQAIMDIIND